MMKVPDHLYVLGDIYRVYMSHVNKVQLIRVKIICVAVIRRASLREAWFFIESLLSPV
jgi:hypothetical protein